MCQTQPLTRTTDLGFRWVLPVTDDAAGYLVITKGHAETTYRVRLLERDPGVGELYRLQRLDVQADGSEVVGEVYNTTLGGHHDSCTCRGYEFARGNPRSCRHTTQLRAAVEWLDNGGWDQFAAGAPAVA